jgi:hypothetical protein
MTRRSFLPTSRTWSLLRRRSSALLFAAAAPILAGAQLTPGAERQLATPEVEAHARAAHIDVASGGTTMLAVWSDRRTDRGTDIFAARLDRNGRLLDQTNIPVSVTVGIDESDPLVEYDGTRYLVVWFDGTNTIASEIATDGTIVTGPKVIAPGRPTTLVRTNPNIAIAMTDEDGTTIGVIRPGLEFVQSARLRQTQQVAIAKRENGYVVFFAEPAGSRAALRVLSVDSRGRAETINRGTLGTFAPDLNFAMASVDGTPIVAAGARDRFIVARLESDGALTPITTIETGASRIIEEVVPRGDDFDVVAIISGASRVFRYVDEVLVEESQPLAGLAEAGAATVNAGRLFTVWQIDGMLRGRFAFGGDDPRVDISQSVPNQQMPVLATDGTNVLAVWIDDVSETRDRIQSRIIGRDGTPASAEARTVATRTVPAMMSPPGVVYSGGQYVVAYVDAKNGLENPAHLTMRTVDRSGLSSGDIPVTTTASLLDGPALAAGPTDALLVWSRSAPNARVRAAFVSNPQNHIEISELLREPAVVYANNSYLIVGATSAGSIRGLRMSTAGVLGATLFETIGTNDSKPAIATNATEQLVVFRRGTSIWGRLIGTGLELAIAESGDNPRVTWDGTAFVAAWQDVTDVFVARVLTNGTVESPVVLSATPLNDEFPALLGLGGGNTLAAYQRMVPELHNVYRVFTRPIVTQTPEPPKPGKRRSVR